MLVNISIDLIQYIIDFLDTYSALQCFISSKYINTHIHIKILDHNSEYITKNVLEQKKYLKVEILNLSDSNIKDCCICSYGLCKAQDRDIISICINRIDRRKSEGCKRCNEMGENA